MTEMSSYEAVEISPLLKIHSEYELASGEKTMCSDEKIIGLSFKSVEILVSEFLPNILSSHTKCHEIIHVLQKFVSQRNLVNVSLSAVNLFLNVADQVEDIKEVLLGLCKVATDSRPEVSVVSSVFLALEHSNTNTPTQKNRFEIAP